MSHLFLAADADVLAGRLLEEIAARHKTADPFEPVSIVVPNRFVQQWLKLRIARDWGVAINLKFSFLEHALWEWLREIDPRPYERPPEFLDADRYHLLVLSILWNDADPAVAPLQAFCEKREAGRDTRVSCRRAWQLAGRLGSLIRDYEYHRQESIIQNWLAPDAALEVPAAWSERAAAQRAVFRAVVDEAAGRRAILNRVLGRNFKTLPQYVMEFHYEVQAPRVPPRRLIYLFGLSQSPLHLRALQMLNQFHEFRVYHLNPLVSRVCRTGLPTRLTHPDARVSEARTGRETRPTKGTPPTLGGLQKLAGTFRGDERPDAEPGTELVHAWGRAAAESLGVTADFLRDPRFRASLLPNPKASRPATVLSRLQEMILGTANEASGRLPQDVSLQIVRCPGIWREVETIRAGIVSALDKDPKLQQTDIAVLVADMDLYRPVLTAVFERPPRRLSFGLADYTAARVSTFGQALLGMLDLALANLSRSRVFEVLLNPCVLARLGVEREAALHWLTWAENLGIHHGWDAAEKAEQGYRASPLYSWKLGLQRLRLGRYMNVVPDDGRQAAPQWQGVIPFADVESGDRDQLDAFCRVVEGMLPMLVRLRGLTATAAEWAQAVLALMQRFLTVPDDRPEEEPVQGALIESLRRFGEWDALHEADVKLPLALMREFVASHLQDIPGRRNDVLSSGITIAALQPQRPIPFEVIFLAGMGEAHFPGGAVPSPFDLRQIQRQPGDILPAEQKRFAFLEAILSARKKLVITYNARDLQKDEDLQPGIPVTQLERFLAARIVEGHQFHAVTVPLVAHDAAYLDAAARLPYQDCLVQDNRADRVLALDAAERAGRLTLSLFDRDELFQERERLASAFVPSATAPRNARPTPTVGLIKLRKFLENPAAAALRYHLRADDEWDEGRDEDFEPLTSPKYVGKRLVTQTIERIVQRAEAEPVADLAREWPAEFERKYREWTQRGQLPEGAFGAVDAEVLHAQVASGLNEGGMLEFLEAKAGKTWCGPYTFGASETPIGAKRRAAALVLPLARVLDEYPEGAVRLVGAWSFAWQDDASLDLLVFHSGKADAKKPLCRGLFDPILFAVSLAALGELAGRAVKLHLARPDGVVPVPLAGALLSEEAARAYLSELATDFLDGGCADQLPFDILQEKAWLPLYQDEESANLGAALLGDWRRREANNAWGYNAARVNALTALGFRVPDDAAEKLRRRFRPLHLLLPPPEAPTSAADDEPGGDA